MRRGPVLGEVEESFIQGLVAGDTFVFAGRLLRFEGVKGLMAQGSAAAGGGPTGRGVCACARLKAGAPHRARGVGAPPCRSRLSWPTGCAASCRIPRGTRSCR